MVGVMSCLLLEAELLLNMDLEFLERDIHLTKLITPSEGLLILIFLHEMLLALVIDVLTLMMVMIENLNGLSLLIERGAAEIMIQFLDQNALTQTWLVLIEFLFSNTFANFSLLLLFQILNMWLGYLFRMILVMRM